MGKRDPAMAVTCVTVGAPRYRLATICDLVVGSYTPICSEIYFTQKSYNT